ncbi:hypothetical protein H4J38_14410 [Colwellia sp. BRX10-3]|uniref:hypothetical protein n=1 Tax=Colwellia sp. BRX10-3 TaxID=2759844 RepID=UPI0015F40201|nr:hypothetical protein [Colwellia sp. BRX10-3]MBA6391965.1 hypothetical protein [Colwellia sp. BRX10-3]
MNKSTLDFINKNINTNAQASSYPLRKQQEIKHELQNKPSAKPVVNEVSPILPGSPFLKSAQNNNY